MRCPVCHSYKHKVTGTMRQFQTLTHRYRRCLNCGSSFQTNETIDKNTVDKDLIRNLIDKDSFWLQEFQLELFPFNDSPV